MDRWTSPSAPAGFEVAGPWHPRFDTYLFW
jgi:hypothetical protein